MSKQPLTAEQRKERQAELELEKLELQVRDLRRDNRKNARLATLAVRKAQIEVANMERAQSQAEALDVESGEYFFNDGVDGFSLEQCYRDLNRISRRFPGKPITIIINSPGGSVQDGLALYDHVRDIASRGHHITTKVRGRAASMGGILLQAGDDRIVGENSMVLIHEVSGGVVGNLRTMQDRVDLFERMWNRLAHILAARSTMSAEEIVAQAMRNDWWLWGPDAVELGFADRIG